MIIKQNNQNAQDVIQIVNDNHRKKKFLIPQHIDANDEPDFIDVDNEMIDENEESERIPRVGHWILTVYVPRINEIFVLNSLQSYSPKTYLAKEAFPSAKMTFLTRLPKQVGGVDCGYWVWFYIFLLYVVEVPLERIEEFIGILSNEYFHKIKNIIKNIPLKAEKYIPVEYKEFIQKNITEKVEMQKKKKSGKK